MSDRKTCVNCKYEDASKAISSSDPRYPRTGNSWGVAIWCKHYERYIGNTQRQGLRKKDDGTYEKYICPSFIHY